ncbi:MAG: TadE/TadG family type IV pilus assembly protein [Sulfitobacter sp.]
MKRNSLSFLRWFRRNEDGNMTIEFVLLVPLLFTMFMTSVELGIYSMRQMFLDRGLDMAVRTVRLSTGLAPQHDDIKQLVCDNSGFLDDCNAQLQLEMKPVEMRGFAGLDNDASCVDASEQVEPLRYFHGSEHQLMLMRACYKFEPIFPTTGLGKDFAKDGTGRSEMVSVSAFVQEPK